MKEIIWFWVMNGFLPMRNCCYFSRTGLKKQERVSGNVACGALRVSLKFLPWAQALGALLLCTSFTAFSKSAWMPFKWYVEVVLSMWVLVQNQPLPQVFSRGELFVSVVRGPFAASDPVSGMCARVLTSRDAQGMHFPFDYFSWPRSLPNMVLA